MVVMESLHGRHWYIDSNEEPTKVESEEEVTKIYFGPNFVIEFIKVRDGVEYSEFFPITTEKLFLIISLTITKTKVSNIGSLPNQVENVLRNVLSFNYNDVFHYIKYMKENGLMKFDHLDSEIYLKVYKKNILGEDDTFEKIKHFVVRDANPNSI